MFDLAHLSDPHLPLPPACLAAAGGRLAPKQRLALLSWLRKRRHISTWGPDPALRADLRDAAPDHLAVIGDLINLGLPEEYAAAERWLRRLAPVEQLSLVPGNHDRLVRGAREAGLDRWTPWFGDGGDRAGCATPFPFLRRRGAVALIGLDSGVPTRIGSAAGRLGHRQIAGAAALLDRARERSLFRVVLIHHPPLLGPGGPRKALRDRVSLRRMLRRHGAELVLHGHHHRFMLRYLDGPRGAIPVFGVPAALSVVARPEPAGWCLHRVERDDGGGWLLRSEARGFDADGGRFATLRRWTHRLAQ